MEKKKKTVTSSKIFLCQECSLNKHLDQHSLRNYNEDEQPHLQPKSLFAWIVHPIDTQTNTVSRTRKSCVANSPKVPSTITTPSNTQQHVASHSPPPPHTTTTRGTDAVSTSPHPSTHTNKRTYRPSTTNKAKNGSQQ